MSLTTERAEPQSSAQTRRYVTDDQSEVSTPRVRTTARRLLFWIVVGVIVLLIVGTIFALTGSSVSTARLSATNPKPAGAKALIQVLRADGVDVHTPHTLQAAMNDSSATGTTLVLYDRDTILDADQLRLLGSVSNLILIEPSYTALTELDPTVSAAGYASSKARASCSFGPAVRAGTVAGLGKAYRSSGATGTGSGVQECFASSGGVYSLIRTDTGAIPGTTFVTVLGSSTLMTNDSITRSGNAALALGLFGQTKNLVWYLPSFADSDVTQDGVVPVPPWVELMYVLAGIVILAAIFWRGRRLGPVVVERLPVLVRASETVEGRARLYQKASARTHAIDALRMGTLTRLARLCGLPKRASLDDVLGAVARATGRPLPQLRALLVDDIPNNDARFMSLSDQLLELEAQVAKATRPA